MLPKKAIRNRLGGLAVLGLAATAIIWQAGDRSESKESSKVESTRQGSASGHQGVQDVAGLRRLVTSSPVEDYPGLMKQVLKMRDPEAQKEMIADLMKRWLLADPESLGAYLDELAIEGEQVWQQLAPGMIAALRNLDPKVSASFEVRNLLERVIVKAAETSPHEALAWAREFLSGINLDSALGAIAAELANIDPEAAIAAASGVKALSNRMEAFAGIGMVLGAGNPDLGLSWAQSFTLEAERAYALSGVLAGLADRDSRRASAEYSEVVETMKTKFRERVIADRAAAGASTDEEYEGLSPEEILKAELAKPNPNLVYLEKAAYIIGTALARDNPQMALEWARTLDIYQGRAAAMEAVFEEWAFSSPGKAYESYLGLSDRGPDLAERLFNAWASSDSSAASEAALALPEGVERDSAMEGVARGWIDSGAAPQEIAAWSERLANASEKDRVRAVVASESAMNNPVFAWNQLQQIQNFAKRTELFHEVFPSLAENNPKVARRALASIGLSSVETEYFENMLGN